MRSRLVVLAAAGAALLSLSNLAIGDPPPGMPDPTFGDADQDRPGTALRSFDLGDDTSDDQGLAMIGVDDGMLVIAGTGHFAGGAQCMGLMRFLPDGGLDSKGFGFDPNANPTGKICHAGPQIKPDLSIVRQEDGQILLGAITLSNGGHPYICRHLSDGSRDTGFGDESSGCVELGEVVVAPSSAAPVVLANEDSIFVIANRNNVGPDAPVLLRLSATDGSVQPIAQDPFVSLLPDGMGGYIQNAVLTPDGDVIAVGATATGQGDFLIVRFDPQTGQRDFGFDSDGMVLIDVDAGLNGIGVATAVSMLDGDRILVAGEFAQSIGNAIGVVQLSASTGVVDEAFNGGTALAYQPCLPIGGCYLDPEVVVRTAEGSLVIAGALFDGVETNMFAARLNDDGSVDTAYGSTQGLSRIALAGSAAHGVVMQGERVVLGGVANYESGNDFALVRLSDGSLFGDDFEDVQ